MTNYSEEKTYIVYERNGNYYICESSFRPMISDEEIIEEHLFFYDATRIVTDLNWKKFYNK